MYLRQKQKGMSLLEVLVSILIIAISLTLSLIMLQAAIRYNESAANKNVALFEIQSIISKIRANSAAKDKYIIDSQTTYYPEQSGFYLDCFNKNCSSDEVASRDIAEWIGNIKSSLPKGNGKIEKISPLIYAITISWTQINPNAKETKAAKNDVSKQEIKISFSI